MIMAGVFHARSTHSVELSQDASMNRQPWDNREGDQITCVLCGIQLACLGRRGKGYYNHTLEDHGQFLEEHFNVRLNGDSERAVKLMQDFSESQGWGRPPVTSLVDRDRKYQKRKADPEYLKKLRRRMKQAGEQRQ